MRSFTGLVAAALLVLSGSVLAQGVAADAAVTAASVAPAITLVPGGTGLTDGQALRVVGRGFTAHAAVVVVQCAVDAATQGPDFCNERFAPVSPVGADGSFGARFIVHPLIVTAAGTLDCRTSTCLVGAENLQTRSELAFQLVGFASRTSAATSSGVTAAPMADRGAIAVATPGRPAAVRVTAQPAGDLEPGRVGTVIRASADAAAGLTGTGEGLLRLTMSGPGTAWRDPRNTSVVVDASVDGGQPQTLVLFGGSEPFTYEGFVGQLATGPHTITVSVRSDLSLTASVTPTARIDSAELLIVLPSNPVYLALSYAPVLYGRSVNAHSDTPLLTYAGRTDKPDGSHALVYTVVWSNEDAGTGFVPFLLRGSWGRMADIETVMTIAVDSSGNPAGATYFACSRCPPTWPENRTALNETDVPFAGQWFGHHPVLRVATGNNDLRDSGTTPFRFQQALAAPPFSGDTREGAMDRNPWSYSISDREVRRERDDLSVDPHSPAPGTARQYLIVQLDTVAAGTEAVDVDIQLAGDHRTWSNAFGTTYPLYNGGVGRTTVKVPRSEVDRPITKLTMRLLPSSVGPATLAVHSVKLLEYRYGAILERSAPPPQISVQGP